MAIATLVAFLVAFEVLPGLHLATHDHFGAHHHDASGAFVRDDVSSQAGSTTPPHDELVPHTHRARHVYPRLPRDDDRDRPTADQAAHRRSHLTPHALATARRALSTDASYLLATELEHGRGSLAHHAAAVPPPSAILTEPLPIDRRATSVVTNAIVELRSVAPSTARARGPPAAMLAVI